MCPRGMQISRSRPRVDHVLTVEFLVNAVIQKPPENINVFRGLIWLGGLDLNQRPSGYEKWRSDTRFSPIRQVDRFNTRVPEVTMQYQPLPRVSE